MIADIKIQRQLEIYNDEHLCTYPPLYVVYDVIETCCEHDSGFSGSTSLKYDECKYLRYFDEDNWIEAEKDTENWNNVLYLDEMEFSSVLKVSFHDKFITCCFTKMAANDYIQREKHNLNNPYIFVHHIPYRNIQLTEIGQLFGDK